MCFSRVAGEDRAAVLRHGQLPAVRGQAATGASHRQARVQTVSAGLLDDCRGGATQVCRDLTRDRDCDMARPVARSRLSCRFTRLATHDSRTVCCWCPARVRRCAEGLSRRLGPAATGLRRIIPPVRPTLLDSVVAGATAGAGSAV